MNPLITRWKMEPSKNGPLSPPLALGWEYDFSPVASPRKFATVLGAWSGNRMSLMSPSDVRSVAVVLALGSVTIPSCQPRWDSAPAARVGHRQGVGRRSAGAFQLDALAAL